MSVLLILSLLSLLVPSSCPTRGSPTTCTVCVNGFEGTWQPSASLSLQAWALEETYEG